MPKKIKRFLRQVERTDWIINENAGIPPIVEKDLWERANKVLLVEQKNRCQTSLSTFLLTGIIFTGDGKSAMVGSSGGYYRRKDGKTTKKRYYINNNWHCQGISSGVKRIGADVIEELIIAAIKDNLTDPGLVSKIESALERLLSDSHKQNNNQREIKQIEKDLLEKETAVRNLTSAIERSNGQVDSLLSSLKEREGEKRSLESRRSQLMQLNNHNFRMPSSLEIGHIVSKKILEFEKTLKSAPIEEQKEFIRQWVQRIEVTEENGTKKAQAYIRSLPKTLEFEPVHGKSVGCGPCRT